MTKRQRPQMSHQIEVYKKLKIFREIFHYFYNDYIL